MPRLIPMPSPRGTNREGLHLDAERFPIPGVANDAMPRRRMGRDASEVRGMGDPADPEERLDNPAADGDPMADLMAHLESCGMSGPDLEKAKELAMEMMGGDGNPATDEPEPFPGRPRPGGKVDPVQRAEDARARMRVRRSTAAVDPNFSRLRRVY